MNKNAPAARTRRRLIATTVAIASIALVATAAWDTTAVVAILHPMQPIGNIDCCH